ncbi:hypothetical protein AALP_AA1G130400 [Arabis alpina]|uniref:Uncharacterized protein n=1 Tax=Arabis alpina TaxID=50452 RepID=A0A087HMX8_ARAAL|nr:hypothetical protein AALP_AA1G130400 [Arabis alpina]
MDLILWNLSKFYPLRASTTIKHVDISLSRSSSSGNHCRCYAAAPEPNRKTKSTSSLTKQPPSITLISPPRRLAATLAAKSGANVARFASLVDSEFLSKGISLNLRPGKIEIVLMKRQFRAMSNSVQIEKAIDLMEIRVGFRFKIKDLVDPLMSMQCCLLPHTKILLCRIIYGFGKKGDMVSGAFLIEFVT